MQIKKNKYYPYCRYCGSCGVDDCCSPTKCLNNNKGDYCKYNQKTLKISYCVLNDFLNILDHEKYPEIEKLLNDLYEKNEKEFENSIEKKLSFFSKIKNFLKK